LVLELLQARLLGPIAVTAAHVAGRPGIEQLAWRGKPTDTGAGK
jgi:hypothetical protein